MITTTASNTELPAALETPSVRAIADAVAVIIVNYNSGDYLRQCLLALARQTRRPDRVIVVDNGSHDDSLSGARTAYPGVETIPAGKNLGFAAANNLAVRCAADCRWVALVNADAFPAPDWLEQLLAAARQSPECHFFASRLIRAREPHRLDGTGDVYHVSGRAWRRDEGAPVVGLIAPHGPLLGACAAAAMYLREAWLDVGGFDEDYFCFYEDVDLAFRLQLAGHALRYVPAAVAQHVGAASTGRQSDFSTYYGHRNLVWTYVKNMPGRLFWLYLPQHIVLNLATVVWFTIRGRGRVICRAKWDAARGLLRVWQKRREIQARRTVSTRQIQELLLHGTLPALRGR